MSANHGSSTAAWVAVALCLLGFTIGALGMVLGPNWTLFWIGAALLPISAIVGKVMSAGSSASH
jgi:hypothetical protein